MSEVLPLCRNLVAISGTDAEETVTPSRHTVEEIPSPEGDSYILVSHSQNLIRNNTNLAPHT